MARLKHKIAELKQQKQHEVGRTLTLTEIAEAAGVSRQTLSNWINQGDIPSLRSDALIGLLRYFGKRNIEDIVYIDWNDEARRGGGGDA